MAKRIFSESLSLHLVSGVGCYLLRVVQYHWHWNQASRWSKQAILCSRFGTCCAVFWYQPISQLVSLVFLEAFAKYAYSPGHGQTIVIVSFCLITDAYLTILALLYYPPSFSLAGIFLDWNSHDHLRYVSTYVVFFAPLRFWAQLQSLLVAWTCSVLQLIHQSIPVIQVLVELARRMHSLDLCSQSKLFVSGFR